MNYLIMYLFGVVSGILGVIIWAVFQAGGKQSRGEEAVEKAIENKNQ